MTEPVTPISAVMLGRGVSVLLRILGNTRDLAELRSFVDPVVTEIYLAMRETERLQAAANPARRLWKAEPGQEIARYVLADDPTGAGTLIDDMTREQLLAVVRDLFAEMQHMRRRP